MTCEYCYYMDLNMNTSQLICKKTGEEVELTKRKCNHYILREDLFKEGSCCGVCLYMLMDEYCAKHKKYTKNTNSICKDFEACIEFIKGEIGW